MSKSKRGITFFAIFNGSKTKTQSRHKDKSSYNSMSISRNDSPVMHKIVCSFPLLNVQYSFSDRANISFTNFKEKMDSKLDVSDMREKYHQFGIFDYVVFVGMLIGCALIGLLYAFKKRGSQEDVATEYLMGGRKMSVFPISVSLVAR